MTQRTVAVKLDGDLSGFNRAMLSGVASAKAFSNELDSSTDRATNLTQSVLAIGPALVPIGAAGVPAVAGLANQLAFAATGAGVAALAFSGIGDALKATNDYAIDPSTANLEKLSQSLAELGPAGRDFVAFLQELRPQLQTLQDAAQGGLFPGVEEGLTDLMELLPQVESIVTNSSIAMGQLVAEAGDNLNDEHWREFFTFLETEARPTLLNTGRTLGNFTEGLANLWMTFDPLSDDFSSSFLQMSRDFAQWTDGLDETEGFVDFVAYIQENGPQAWDTLTSIGDGLLQIVEAAAPVGAAALPIIEDVADAIGAVADSDLGPVIIGVISLTSALSRMKALGTAMNTSAIGGLLSKSTYSGAASAAKDIPAASRAFMQFDAAAARASMSAKDFAVANGRLGASMRGAARLAGGAGGLAFVMSDLDNKMGLTNTTMGAMIGSAIPGWGTAIGAAAGLAIDLTQQVDSGTAALKQFQEAFAATSNVDDQASILAAAQRQVDLLRNSGVDFVQDEANKLAEGLVPLREQHRLSALAADDAKFAEAGLSAAMALASDETRQETLALLENTRVKNQNADITGSAFSAETNYRRALKEAQEQARKTNAGIDGSSEAALRNRDLIYGLAGAWNRQADAGGKTTAQMRKAQAAFIRVAEDMGVGSERAKQLAEDLFHIPSPKPKVEVSGAEKAVRLARAIKAALDAINPFKRISVVTTNTTVYDHGQQKADGGEISGPGGPRDDLIPIMASNKEIVVNARDAQEHRDLLLGINAGRFRGRRPQMHADGGEIGRIQPMTETRLVRVPVSSVAAPTGPAQPLVLDGAVVGYVRAVAGQVVMEGMSGTARNGGAGARRRGRGR